MKYPRLAWHRLAGPVSPAACQSHDFAGSRRAPFSGFDLGERFASLRSPPKKDESELSLRSIHGRYCPWAFRTFVSILDISKWEVQRWLTFNKNKKNNYHKGLVDAMGGHSIYHWKIPTTKNRKTKKNPHFRYPLTRRVSHCPPPVCPCASCIKKDETTKNKKIVKRRYP